jgi:cell shape-determining protein MreC
MVTNNGGASMKHEYHHNSAKAQADRITSLEAKVAKRDRIISSLKDQRSQFTKDYGVLAQENQLLKQQMQEQTEYFNLNLSEL